MLRVFRPVCTIFTRGDQIRSNLRLGRAPARWPWLGWGLPLLEFSHRKPKWASLLQLRQPTSAIVRIFTLARTSRSGSGRPQQVGVDVHALGAAIEAYKEANGLSPDTVLSWKTIIKIAQGLKAGDWWSGAKK